jgi:Uma2 family endonuclease
MTISMENLTTAIEYPDTDGLPMAESDHTCNYLIYAREALKAYFQDRSDIYVAGNLFIYYEEGNPKAVVAPDIFVVFGVENHNRRSYKVWQENNKLPDFVLEITSKSTVGEDQGTKKGLYAYLGVKEYFQYDPTADYLTPPLQGLRLIEGNYLPIPSNYLASGELSITSQILALELRLQDGEMRFYNPATGKKLLSYQELEQAKLEAEQAKLEEQEKAAKLAAKLRELGIDPEKL